RPTGRLFFWPHGAGVAPVAAPGRPHTSAGCAPRSRWWPRGPLGGDPLGHAGAVVQRVRGAGGEARGPPLTVANRLGLDPVLAQRGEVDDEVGGVEQPFPDVYELSHGGQATAGAGRNRSICRGSCSPPSGARRPPGEIPDVTPGLPRASAPAARSCEARAATPPAPPSPPPARPRIPVWRGRRPNARRAPARGP